MATDYISRSKAMEILSALLIESAMNNVGHETDASDVFEDIAKNRLDTWLNLVPAADVVSVVRCRDCAHFLCFGNTMECGLYAWGNGNGLENPQPDEYCSRGVRKEPI